MEFLRTNETLIENECCDIFPNQVSMEEVFMIETMEKNQSLQTQSSAIQSEEEKIEANLHKLHLQREKWRGHDRNAMCWSFFIVNDNNIVDGSKP
jgi:FtsZ-binding cell division protein ZapB